MVALGIIYGDIGTSPLYVFKAVIGDSVITKELVWGGLSCIFWTLTILTTFKYVTLVLAADNNGEGGIFSLYALVRRKAKWLVVPAMIGGSALLADGMITPPISVSSAIEGLEKVAGTIPTVPIVCAILSVLFFVQQFGTKAVGSYFGPMMAIWFGMIATVGMAALMTDLDVLYALNPIYGLNLLFKTENGFWLLGAVFLCTTGAEALYSDLGHCGKQNVRATWAIVKPALILNYFGQGAWLLLHEGQKLDGRNPFFEMVPGWFLVPSIVIATFATVIASQALISGSFTLVAEAIRLSVFPKCRIVYPTEVMGQIYVPFVNLLLFIGCIAVTLYFQRSEAMEAAYGLAITVTMLVTTFFFAVYLRVKRFPYWIILSLVFLLLPIEISFLVANLAKFTHGGWVTLFIGAIFFTIMWVWLYATKLKAKFTEYEGFRGRLPSLELLGQDSSISKYCTHLVYLTGAVIPEMIETKIIYSLFRKDPKRADVYWFIHVNVDDEPYTSEYDVTTLIPEHAFRIDFHLGFRVEPRVSRLFREVTTSLAEAREVNVTSRYDSLKTLHIPGDFKFVVLEKFISYDNELPPVQRVIMGFYSFLKRFVAVTEQENFGLDSSAVTVEKVPLIISPGVGKILRRIQQPVIDRESFGK